MKEIWTVICRFVAPYKLNVVLNIVFNFLAAFLTLFSFAVIIPILEMLFGIREAGYTLMAWSEGSLKDVAFNNFYYYTQEMITECGQVGTLALLGALLVLMTAIKSLAYYMGAWFIIPMRNGIVRDMRKVLYDKVTHLPLAYFTESRKGDVMARMTGDVTQIEVSIMTSLDMFFKNPVIILVCLVMMIFISWQLTVFVLVLLPVAGYLLGQIGKQLKSQSYRGQTQWGVLMTNIEETLGGLRIIKAFNAEDKVNEKFGRENQTFYKISNKIARRESLAHPVSETLGTLIIAIVLLFGGTLIINGVSNITAASFIYYMVIFYSIINPAKELSKSLYSIQRGLASMQRVDAILDAQNPINDPVDPVSITDFKGRIKYDNVTFSYNPGVPVLRNINLDIPAGATVAVVGQSGSGKSTLADMLPRFYDTDSGRVTVDGVDVRDLRVHDLRSYMGCVNQEAILFNDTIYNNITFGVDNATQEQVEEAARIANAHEFIIETEQGYQTNIGDRGCRLSGGQRQRLSIARAILKNPPILIFDEATSALDSKSEKSVQEALERLMKNRTTIVIAHRLSTIRNADIICVMNEGQIVEQGTHDQLIALNGYYKRLVDMQKF